MAGNYPPDWRARAAVPGLLEPGERLLWMGKPARWTGTIPPGSRPGIIASCGAFVLFMLWALLDCLGGGEFSFGPVGFLAIRDAEAAVTALAWLRAQHPVAPPAHPWDASRDDPTDPERAA